MKLVQAGESWCTRACRCARESGQRAEKIETGLGSETGNGTGNGKRVHWHKKHHGNDARITRRQCGAIHGTRGAQGAGRCQGCGPP